MLAQCKHVRVLNSHIESAQDLRHVVGIFSHFSFRQINEWHIYQALALLRDRNVEAFEEDFLHEDTACRGSGLEL